MPALTGKAIVVTGAGSGIGAAYARLAAQEGAAVVVSDIDANSAQDVASSIVAAGGRAISHVGDVADWSASEDLMSRCEREFGSLDGLINNAGIEPVGKAWALSEAEIRTTVETNLVGTLFCGRHAMRIMVERGRGSIVNVTSGAQLGLTDLSAYAATKGAIAAATHCWALDLDGTGVRVNAVSPLAATKMSAHNARAAGHLDPDSYATFMRAFPAPEHNAPLAVYLLSDAARGVTGQIVRVDAAAITLVSHPLLLSASVPRRTWTIDAVADAFASTLTSQLQPLGVKALAADGSITPLRRDL